MLKKELIFSRHEISDVVALLSKKLSICSVMTFTGPLGAGKTTLISHLLKECGVNEPITSPTFNYVNVYENTKGELFYHFDLYRVAFLDQFINAGFNEFLYAKNSWALIEWPEVIMPLLTHDVCSVTIDYAEHEKRRVHIVSMPKKVRSG